MKDYYTMCHISKNEDGLEEVNFTYRQTFWQWLFRQPATTEAWVCLPPGSEYWIGKVSGKKADLDKVIEINEVITRIRWNANF